MLGEHLELHMFAGSIKKGNKLVGYVINELVDTNKIEKRHEVIVKEMKRRGWKHKSPLKLTMYGRCGKINVKNNIKELKYRCKECRKLLKWKLNIIGKKYLK